MRNKKKSYGRPRSYVEWLCLAFMACAMPALGADPEWRTVTAEELALADEPQAPGAPAIYLYYQYDRDDNKNREFTYAQIKILKEEGRGYGTLQIAYNKRSEKITDLRARVIQPDGSIEPFTGTVYEKPIASNSRIKQFAKALTLPNVRVGSIVEYQFVRDQPDAALYDTTWILSQDLFMRHGRYSLKPYLGQGLRWSWPRGIPGGASAPQAVTKKLITLETRNVAAFVSEPYMPPALDMKYRVEFVYTRETKPTTNPDEYWKDYAKGRYRWIKAFIDGGDALQKQVDSLVSASDTPEQKLRKLYSHVQQMRNTTYDEELTRQEESRSRDKSALTVRDVIRHGYGDRTELLWYFLALARAAGFEADPVVVGGRGRHFFSPGYMNPARIDSDIVVVRLDGQPLYLDPATPFIPFGVLHFNDTGVHAMRLTGEGGEWFTTPLPSSSAAAAYREAELALGDDGSLQGTIDVTFTGYEAFWRRLDNRHEDDATRRTFLEDDLKEHLATAAEVTLVGQPDWSGTQSALQVRYKVHIPSWAVEAGPKVLVGVGLSGKVERGLFTRSERVHPVYFSYATRSEDVIRILLPAGWKIQSSPATTFLESGPLAYTLQVDPQPGGFRIRRVIRNEITISQRSQYESTRTFYQQVRAGDDEQVVVSR